MTPTFVLVPGAFSNSFGFAPLQRELALLGDRSMPLALQDRLIADADKLTPGNPFDTHSLESSHAGFLVHPGQAADILAGLAG